MMKLYHNDMSVCAQKVRMALEHKGIKWSSEHLNLRAGDQHKPDFLKLNPKAVVPVLQHDDAVITESNAIIEYLEAVYPNDALMPENPVECAKARAWLIRLDSGLHENIAVISFCIAFRFQLLQRYDSEEKLQAFLSNISDPARANLMKDVVPNGLSSNRLLTALYAYKKLLSDMSIALSINEWLIGDQLTLVDFSFLPYIERLQQLKLDGFWSDKPEINAWLERLKETHAYQSGVKDWHNQGYIEMMAAKGLEAWPEVESKFNSIEL